MLASDLILDATLLPAMAVALLAGLLSFLSPCVLPIVPPYLAYMGGVSVTEMAEAREARRRALLSAAFFVLGLSTGPFDVTQPTISHHLRVLREAGLIDCERRGTWVYYWVLPQSLARLGSLLSTDGLVAATGSGA